jgi:hypothetical protein
MSFAAGARFVPLRIVGARFARRGLLVKIRPPMRGDGLGRPHVNA